MDLRALRYFIAVIEAGSLSRAAHSLYVAQPALTAQIKKLEAELGAQLLERSHAGVSPTPAGTQLYEDARRLLSDAEAMRERIKRLPQGIEGSVTIAVPFLLTTLLLGPVIARPTCSCWLHSMPFRPRWCRSASRFTLTPRWHLRR